VNDPIRDRPDGQVTPGLARSAEENAAIFYWILKSLHQFNESEVKGVIDTLISPSERDNCYIGTYYRALGNVETLLGIQNSKGFQAAAMLARTLFELAVDIRLLGVIGFASTKMIVFVAVERLRCARKIVKFKIANPNLTLDTTAHESFIKNEGRLIDQKHRILWPRLSRVIHWSGLRMDRRVALLKEPFREIYEVNYPLLSWYVHSGLTGVANLKAETFAHISAQAFKLAADAYWEVLLATIHEFKIAKADEKIERKMEYARTVPLTNSPEQAQELLRALLR
jgi:hypothetical protein